MICFITYKLTKLLEILFRGAIYITGYYPKQINQQKISVMSNETSWKINSEKSIFSIVQLPPVSINPNEFGAIHKIVFSVFDFVVSSFLKKFSVFLFFLERATLPDLANSKIPPNFFKSK